MTTPAQPEAIEALLKEARRFPPPPAFAAQANAKPGIYEEAAALWESLAQYRPFVDGNERTAFASTYTFLTINGIELLASCEQAYSFIEDLYPTNGFNFEVLVPWLRGHSR